MSSIKHSELTLEKRVPLTIARGTHSHSRVLWLRWQEESIEGWGEAADFSVDRYVETLDDVIAALGDAIG